MSHLRHPKAQEHTTPRGTGTQHCVSKRNQTTHIIDNTEQEKTKHAHMKIEIKENATRTNTN
jgi:hypothetical protein